MSANKLARSAQGLQSSAIRELLKHSKMAGVISLGGGIPNPDLFDREGLKIASDAVDFNAGIAGGDVSFWSYLLSKLYGRSALVIVAAWPGDYRLCSAGL